MSLLARLKKRHRFLWFLAAGVLLFIDNIGRAQVVRDVYHALKSLWSSFVWPTHTLTWAGLGLALIGLIALFWPESPSKKNNESAVAAQERIFVGEGISIEYLTGLFRDHTSAQASKLIEMYLGKWIRYSGSVNDISQRGKYTTISSLYKKPDKDPMPIGVTCYFYDEVAERVLLLRRGQAFQVVGRIERVENWTVALERCELV